MTIDPRYKSRKFLFCLVVVLVASALVAFAGLDHTVYGVIVSTVCSGYLVSNVSQKALTQKIEGEQP